MERGKKKEKIIDSLVEAANPKKTGVANKKKDNGVHIITSDKH